MQVIMKLKMIQKDMILPKKKKIKKIKKTKKIKKIKKVD